MNQLDDTVIRSRAVDTGKKNWNLHRMYGTHSVWQFRNPPARGSKAALLKHIPRLQGFLWPNVLEKHFFKTKWLFNLFFSKRVPYQSISCWDLSDDSKNRRKGLVGPCHGDFELFQEGYELLEDGARLMWTLYCTSFVCLTVRTTHSKLILWWGEHEAVPSQWCDVSVSSILFEYSCVVGQYMNIPPECSLWAECTQDTEAHVMNTRWKGGSKYFIFVCLKLFKGDLESVQPSSYPYCIFYCIVFNH